MVDLPIVMTPSGPIPTPPATLRAALTSLVARTNPGYIANLPGSLIEDVASTDVGGMVISNQFFVDLVNSVTPKGANPFILNQLGVGIYGVQPAVNTNTSVDLIFSGTIGFIIIPGFTVTDNNYQYICLNGGVIGSNGDTLPIHAIATLPGTWPVPAGSVTGLVTSIPENITLAVTNPSDGIPSTGTESVQSFRTRTLTAGLAASTGMDRYLKTLLWNVPGVIQRLVSVRQEIDTCQWTILVGGGDPYQVAWAIYYALGDLSSLARPQIEIVDISNDIPAVVTTAYNHNLVNGMIETFQDIEGNMGPALNGRSYYVQIVIGNARQFSIWNAYDPVNDVFSDPVDGTILLPYTTGGIVTPNPILQQVTLNSYPDNYLIPFILPAQELVTLVVTWNTNSPNYVSPQALSQAAVPALADYINGLYVGLTPINIYELTSIFLEATANIVEAENVTVLTFQVAFDGVAQAPIPDTGVVVGDPNSYFYTTNSNVIVLQE